MSYNEPKPEHRNAITQINDARQRALKAVSELRKRRIQTPHPNLAESREDGESLPVMAAQAVADYLLQLRPYRHGSEKWHLSFDTVTLPKEIPRSSPRRGEQRRASLWLCRQPEVPLDGVSQIIDALNMEIHYSTKQPTRGKSSSSRLKYSDMTPTERKVRDGYEDALPGEVNSITWKIDPPSYPGDHYVDREVFRKIQQGAITQDEAVEMGMTEEQHDADEDDEPEYVPAIPRVDNAPGDTRGTNHKIRTYKFVFGSNGLLKLVQLADEVAAEMDLLIEMEEPDLDAGGSGAV